MDRNTQPGDKVIPNFVATIHGIHDHDKHGKVVQTVDGNVFRLDELTPVEGGPKTLWVCGAAKNCDPSTPRNLRPTRGCNWALATPSARCSPTCSRLRARGRGDGGLLQRVRPCRGGCESQIFGRVIHPI